MDSHEEPPATRYSRCCSAVACPYIKTPGVVWASTLATGGRRCAPSAARDPGRRHRIRAGHRDVGGSRAILAGDPQLPASSRLRLRHGAHWSSRSSCSATGTCCGTGSSRRRSSRARAWRRLRIAPLTMIMAAGVLFLAVVFYVHQCAGMGGDADNDQPRRAAPCAALRSVDAGRVPRRGRRAMTALPALSPPPDPAGCGVEASAAPEAQSLTRPPELVVD